MTDLKIKNQKGFTLIEVMIATGLFVVIMTLGVAAVLNTNVLFKKSQDQRSAIDNMAFILEDMARTIRTGSAFQCDSLNFAPVSDDNPTSCGLNGVPPYMNPTLALEAQGGVPGNSDLGDQVVYYINTDSQNGPDGIYRSDDGGVSLQNQPFEYKLTPDNIKIYDTSGFVVRGAEKSPNDAQQPVVFIRLEGEIQNESEDFVTPFSYQLTVAQRRIDS
jgi:prepilin-type N-terminal cleavage/methylation domain-containing protein